MSKHKGGRNFIFEDTGIVRFRLGRAGLSASDPHRGAVGEMPLPAKKDLRKLGEWMKVKKAVEDLKRQEAERAARRSKGESKTKV